MNFPLGMRRRGKTAVVKSPPRKAASKCTPIAHYRVKDKMVVDAVS
jgi:hypothetical protein